MVGPGISCTVVTVILERWLIPTNLSVHDVTPLGLLPELAALIEDGPHNEPDACRPIGRSVAIPIPAPVPNRIVCRTTSHGEPVKDGRVIWGREFHLQWNENTAPAKAERVCSCDGFIVRKTVQVPATPFRDWVATEPPSHGGIVAPVTVVEQVGLVVLILGREPQRIGLGHEAAGAD